MRHEVRTAGLGPVMQEVGAGVIAGEAGGWESGLTWSQDGSGTSLNGKTAWQRYDLGNRAHSAAALQETVQAGATPKQGHPQG